MIQRPSMYRYLVPVLVCTCAILAGLPDRGSAAVSPRPVVQKNFRQLIETNSCPSCDLAGAVLTRLDLSGADLEGANLAGARLYLANLSGANLKNANLQGAGLGGADLANADLTGANLTGAVLEGAYLKGALMDGVVTTRHDTDGDGVTGAGKTVFVSDESRPKHAPYTQEAVVAPERDAAAGPAGSAGAAGDDGHGQVAAGDTAASRLETGGPGKGPKRLPPMADAVVPAAVVPEKPEAGGEEVVQLAAVAKEKPAEGENREREEVPGAGQEDAAARSGQAPELTPAPVGDDDGVVPAAAAAGEETVAPQEAEAPVAAGPAAVEAAPQARDRGDESSGREDVATDGSPERPGIPAEETGTDAAQRQEPAAAATSAGPGPDDAVRDVTPVGPATADDSDNLAAAKRKVLVERLLDDNQCPECDLQGVDLSGRWLSDADLERADLRGADLEGTDLENANLKGADLRGANLKKADLRGADLYMANLGGADLTGARMEGTLTDSADLTGAIGVPADRGTRDE